MRLISKILILAILALPANLFAVTLPCPVEPDQPVTQTMVFFLGGGPRVTNLDFIDAREDGEAHFSKEADFVGVKADQPYACLDKATSLSNLVMQTSHLIYPGAVLVPVRIQNCKGEFFKDSDGRDIDPRTVAAWLTEKAQGPAVVVFGFVPNKRTPHLGELISTLQAQGLTVVSPKGASDAALLESLLQAGREAATLQAIVRQPKVLTPSCTNTAPPDQTVHTGTFTSPTFPCEDTAKKNQAIQNLLGQLGYTAALCTGSCTSGGCKPTTLTSGEQDDVNLQLIDNGTGTCYYTATVTGSGKAYFRASCGCIC
jgi:hypothetical protein